MNQFEMGQERKRHGGVGGGLSIVWGGRGCQLTPCPGFYTCAPKLEVCRGSGVEMEAKGEPSRSFCPGSAFLILLTDLLQTRLGYASRSLITLQNSNGTPSHMWACHRLRKERPVGNNGEHGLKRPILALTPSAAN